MLVENNPEESGFWLVIKAGKRKEENYYVPN
jgi:hypothetical protein